MKAAIDRTGWIMLAGGVLTATMFSAAIAPRAALRSAFGETLEGPLAEIVVRNWGALIGIVGLLLVAGAFHPPLRRAALLVGVASKLVFIALVLAFGRRFLSQPVAGSIAVDALMVVLFAACLLPGRRPAGG